MAQAIVIAGYEKRHFDEVRRFRKYLLLHAGLKKVFFFATAYTDVSRLGKKLRTALTAIPSDEPLLLAYYGHGSELGWAINSKGGVFTYDMLIEMIKNCQSPILIVNDCCFSSALEVKLKEANVSPDTIGIISACGPGEFSYGGLLQDACLHWYVKAVFLSKAEDGIVWRIDDLGPPREEVTNRIQHYFSIFLHHISHRRFPIVPLRIIVHFPRGSAGTEDTKGPEIIPRRWGAKLDECFFPSRQ